MNGHLPECPAGYVADLCTTDIDPVLQEPSCNHCVGQGCICICNRLRTCEQRVLDAAWGAVATIAWPTGTEHFPTDYDYAWNDGVIESLAAIEALKEDNDQPSQEEGVQL